LVNETNGWGWIVTDDQIGKANDWLLNHKVRSSLEGALALAALWKAQSHNFKLKKNLLVVLT